MYELLVLGALVSRKMSGYKLRKILGNSLIPRREISNGVMYPLLRRLEEQGLIIQLSDPNSSRGEKIASITDAGRARFQKLMVAPVADDGKRESVYQFKVRAFAGVQPDVQRAVLDAYSVVVQSDVDEYIAAREHLQAKIDAGVPQSAHLAWSVQTIDLNIALSEAKQRWIASCRRRVKLTAKNKGGMDNAK